MEQLRDNEKGYYDFAPMDAIAIGMWMCRWILVIDKKRSVDSRYEDLKVSYSALSALYNSNRRTPDTMAKMLEDVNEKIKAVYDEVESAVHWADRPTIHPGEYIP